MINIIGNNQTLFDKVATHLRVQARPAVSGIDNCAYRLEDGRSCAIGCLIEDKDYNERIEGYNLRDLIEENYITVTEADIPLLCLLQDIHDSWERNNSGQYEFEDIRSRLAQLAIAFDLNYDILFEPTLVTRAYDG